MAAPVVDAQMVAETQEDLARLAREPVEAQVRGIHLMGLEREQIVAVAYREDAIRARVAELDVDEDTRDVIRHAMRWVWKEEEMHTAFVRGVVLRSGGLLVRARAFSQQIAGAIAGWSSSVLHHVRWSAAPLSRFWAHVFTFFGWLAGKVPRAVTRSLRHLSFAEYCRFSASAEATAALCWHRVAELTRAQGGASFYAKMGGDEDHHGAIFASLLEALDEEGRLAPGWDAARLRDRLREIGPFYVAPEHRPGADAQPLGGGGDVVLVCDCAGCAHGPEAGDAERALELLLERLDLARLLDARAAATGTPRQRLRVAIKPTFLRAYHHDDRTPTTSPKLIRALARRLRAMGCSDVAVLESAQVYDWFFEGREVTKVARYIGLEDESLRVVDAEADLTRLTMTRGMVDPQVPETWRDADLRISFGKLSTHPVDGVYLGIAQLESLLPRADENVFVDRRSHRGPATMALLSELPPHLALVDAYEDVADGIGGILACERPSAPRRLYGGRDALAVDLAICHDAGEKEVQASGHLDAAIHWFGDPRGRYEVRGCTEPLRGFRRAWHDERSAVLGFLALPVYLFASGRGALFVPEMDEAAFPEKTRPSLALRAARRGVRWLLQVRRPRAAPS